MDSVLIKGDTMKKGLLGYYNYTVVLTYIGMLTAFTGILMVLNKNFSAAVVCLLISGVCDMFDGKVAATKKRDHNEKCFGIQIDSLSDLVSFGIFPALFVYAFLDNALEAGIIASFYVLAALIRLAYFNVLEEERQRNSTGLRTVYLGLPVTTIALLLPAVHIAFEKGIFKDKVAYLVMLIFVMIGFVSPFEIKKPNTLGKIGMIILGVIEVIGVLFLLRWGKV
jgi:hypothetical protein